MDAKEQNIIRCKECKHYKQSTTADRKMCFRKDIDGFSVCYEFEPNDWCSYAEREEDAFDLTYKTYDELVEAFDRQGALDKKDYMKAIENTNLLYDMTEEEE